MVIVNMGSSAGHLREFTVRALAALLFHLSHINFLLRLWHPASLYRLNPFKSALYLLRKNALRPSRKLNFQKCPVVAARSNTAGFTLVELLFFLVVVAIGLGGVLKVFNDAVLNSVDPVLRVKAVEKSQALMDEILSRKFDENTPTGGYPACGSAGGIACAGIAADSGYDDVGDYHGYTDTSDTGVSVGVAVINAGAELGVVNTDARRITITTVMSDGSRVVLSAYKLNY